MLPVAYSPAVNKQAKTKRHQTKQCDQAKMASLRTLVLTQSCTVDTNVFVIVNYAMLSTTRLMGPFCSYPPFMALNGL